MTACLGRRVAELADGRLVGPERERALAHVAGCASCRDALDIQRAMRGRLAASGQPRPSDDLMARLRAVPAREPVAPIIDLGDRRRQRRRLALAGGSAVVGAVALLGGLGSLGQTAASVPVVTPNLRSFAVEHASTSGSLPVGGPALSAPGAATVSVALVTGQSPQPGTGPSGTAASEP